MSENNALASSWQRGMARARAVVSRVKGSATQPEMVLIYHMGKVGSTSIFDSLVAANVPNIHHLNRLSPTNIAAVRRSHAAQGMPPLPGDDEGLRVYAELQETPHRIKCISPVRDPIRRNLSAYFFTSPRFSDAAPPISESDIPLLRDLFLREYDHDVPLTWFDVEMHPVLGVDVYQHPFPSAEGHLTIRQDTCEILLLKCEMADERKATLVRDFLGMPGFTLQNANQGKDKHYGKVYAQFLERLKLPEAYLDRICNSRFTRHFYSSAEIDAMRRRWSESARG